MAVSEPTRLDLLNHELRQIDHQCQQLRQWIAPVQRELEHLNCWRKELLELREAEQRKLIRVTRCEPGPGPDRRQTKTRRTTDPTMEKIAALSPAQLASLMALLESDENNSSDDA